MEWREAIGATTNAQKNSAPTRLAYRWVKGLAGWQHSAVAGTFLSSSSQMSRGLGGGILCRGFWMRGLSLVTCLYQQQLY